jgi:hypothetical protein
LPNFRQFSPRQACALRRLKTAAGTLGAGVGLAEETPQNLADRSGTVLASRLAATAWCLFAEEVRQITGSRVARASAKRSMYEVKR